jgi:hypothetical protein
LTRQQGSPVTNSQIATVTDDGGDGSVLVKVNGSNTATVNGVTISNIVNTNGTVTADIVANCTASNASFTLQATDGSTLVTNTLNVAVALNTAPNLSYANPPAVSSNGSASVTPTAASDNGSITGLRPKRYAGADDCADSQWQRWRLDYTMRGPRGHTPITIRATDNCGMTTDASFTLTVNKSEPNDHVWCFGE